MHRRPRTFAACIASWLIAASPVAAQDLRVGGVQAWVGHDLLGNPRGIQAELGVPLTARVAVRIGHGRYADDFVSIGSTCVGLIPPWRDCTAEPRDDRARMHEFALSVPVTVLSAPRLRLDVVPSGRTVRLESEQLGLESGRALSAEKRMFGLALGAELVGAPLRDGPLRLHVGGNVGLLHPYEHTVVADGYTPFEETIRLAWIQVGLSFAFQ